MAGIHDILRQYFVGYNSVWDICLCARHSGREVWLRCKALWEGSLARMQGILFLSTSKLKCQRLSRRDAHLKVFTYNFPFLILLYSDSLLFLSVAASGVSEALCFLWT